MKEQLARRTELIISYNGYDLSEDIAKSITNFSYKDAAPGQLDEIEITIEDRGRNWQTPEWFPLQGDYIKATIKTVNWDKPGEIKKLPLGNFDVSTVEFAGEPDTLSIKAVSLPLKSNVRQEVRSKAWEKASLRSIAAEIAKRAKLKLQYLIKDNFTYNRKEQTMQSDLDFLNDLCVSEGVAVKITGNQLVLFDEFVFEKTKPVATIKRGKDNILSFSFSWDAAYAAYIACEVSYTSKKNKTLKARYVPPGAPKLGPILKINESASNQAEALRKAKKSLRDKNKENGTASISLAGDIRLAAGVTIMISGFGYFDNKYLVTSATHSLSSNGYTTDIEIRQALGW